MTRILNEYEMNVNECEWKASSKNQNDRLLNENHFDKQVWAHDSRLHDSLPEFQG